MVTTLTSSWALMILRLKLIRSHRPELLFRPWKDSSSFVSVRGVNESRCDQPEREMGRNVNWLQSYSLGNGNQYEEPTVSSVYMSWMADWVQVEEWELAAWRGTPLSSTAIHFHYSIPLKPAAHNHNWNLIIGKENATIHKWHYSKLPAMSGFCTQCIQRCKSFTIWFTIM